MELSSQEIEKKINEGIFKICEDANETKSVFYLDDKKYYIPNPILEEYAKKYKPEELTADGIPTIETQLREMRERDEEAIKYENNEVIYKREMIQRVKCLSLHKMGLNILFNTFEMHPRERLKLQEIMWSYNDVEHSKIIEEFNELVCSNILDNPKVDLSKLPIYEFRY